MDAACEVPYKDMVYLFEGNIRKDFDSVAAMNGFIVHLG